MGLFAWIEMGFRRATANGIARGIQDATTAIQALEDESDVLTLPELAEPLLVEYEVE